MHHGEHPSSHFANALPQVNYLIRRFRTWQHPCWPSQRPPHCWTHNVPWTRGGACRLENRRAGGHAEKQGVEDWVHWIGGGACAGSGMENVGMRNTGPEVRPAHWHMILGPISFALQPTNWVQVLEETLKPVSYTHLTLPTKA